MPAGSEQNQGCFGYIITLVKRVLGISINAEEEFPYKIRNDFLSPAELSYYQILKTVLGAKAAISTKVRLADILYIPNQKNYRSFFGRISQRHVDFLLCEAATMKPVLVIELDDASHSRSKQVAKDQFLNDALGAAGLPILRVKAQRQYSRDEVVSQLTPYLASQGSQTKPRPIDTTVARQSHDPHPHEPPKCPVCDGTMLLRVAAKGKHKGSRFYGCTNYPSCRGVLPFQTAA